MLRYTLQRLIILPVLLFLFSVIAFALVQAPPGDFLTSYMAFLASSGSSMDAAQVEALRQMYGLDQPIYIQYLKWVGNILHGNLGVSLEWRRPIAELIGERLLLTVVLAIFSFGFTWIMAVPIGIIAATRQYSILGTCLASIFTYYVLRFEVEPTLYTDGADLQNERSPTTYSAFV